MPDTTPDPDFEREPESLPEPGPLPFDDYPAEGAGYPVEGNGDPRVDDRPPPEDFGIPHIDLDRSGRFKVPKLKADYFLLEEANSEFFLGMNLDQPKPIAWLWPGRIPIGKLTLIEGESSSGTSFLVTDMAARVTGGSPWPVPVSQQPADSKTAGSQMPGHVLFVSGGDNTYDTVVPRMINSGANLYDFTVISTITTHNPAEMRAGKADTNRRLSLPDDLAHIEYQVRKRPDTRLVVVDSLSDFCHTDRQFRDCLRGLHEIAERCQVAVVATARPKNWRSARSKLKPSADRRSEGVRCVLNVLVDPHDRSQRYLAPARMNFCREPQWLPFRIGDGKVDWGEPLAAAPVDSRLSEAAQEKVTLLQEAKDCLWKTLAVGDISARDALRQVMECGFSKATIVRARRELGIRSYRENFGPDGWWTWSIKPAGEGPAMGEGCANVENANGESGNGDMPVNRLADVPESLHEQPSSTDEFGGINFERIAQALAVELVNRERAVELAATAEPLPTGKPSKNGKRSKPR